MTLALLVVVGGVYDLGAALAARGRAYDLAAQAARAGANAISPESLRTGVAADLRVDPAAAQDAAQDLLTAAGATGTLTLTDVDVVQVRAHVPRRTAILSIVGIDDVSGTATATATILHGTTTGQRR